MKYVGTCIYLVCEGGKGSSSSSTYGILVLVLACLIAALLMACGGDFNACND